jgi:putative glutamine amidotransferase
MSKQRTARKPPRIGLTPDYESATSGHREPRLFLRAHYPNVILEAGGLPLLLPITGSRVAILAMLDSLHGVLVSGGDFDIHPKFYGERPLATLGKIKETRTQFELDLITLALKRELPILGVCGGEQAINVALGGTLYQDIPSQIPDAIAHQRGEVREVGGHQVRVYEGTRLKRIVGRDTLEVNTTHHQSVKALGKKLIVNAATDDGVIEGIEGVNGSFLLGVQWHPELLAHGDTSQKKIISAFVAACRGKD